MTESNPFRRPLDCALQHAAPTDASRTAPICAVDRRCLRFINFLRTWVLATAIASLLSGGAAIAAQNAPPTSVQSGDVFASQGQGGTTYSDQYSSNCEQQNANNPFAGINPLVCKGEVMPTAGPGVCNFPGMQLIKQQGNTCFYCYPLNPPIQGIILPIDLAGYAEQQGFKCGADQADACMLICTGIGPFKPPAGVTVVSGPPAPPTPAPSPQPVPNPPSLQTGVQQPSPQDCTTTAAAKNPYIECLSGLVAGVGDCVQGTVTAIAGAGHFVMGDFVGAAQIWGIQPGQSAFLGTLYKELNTPTVGQNVTTFQQCQTIGRRICAVVVSKTAAGAAKIAGSAINQAVSSGTGGTAAGSIPGGQPGSPGTGLVPTNGGSGAGGSAPTLPAGSVTQPSAGGPQNNYVITGGTSPGNAIGGLALLDDATYNPAGLAGRYVALPGGPQQLGALVGKGSFAVVYQTTGGDVIKISTNAIGSMNALQGQVDGTKILNNIGIATPSIRNYQPATARSAGSLVASDFNQQWPGASQLSSKTFADMTPADQNAVLGMLQQAATLLGNSGNVMLDTNPANFAALPNGGAFIAIVIDADMIMPASQVQSAAAKNVVIAGVLNYLEKSYGKNCQSLQQPIDARSFMNNVWLPTITYRLRNGSGAK